MNLLRTLPSEKVLNALPDAVIVLNQHGTIIFANDAFAHMLGYRSSELLERPITDFLHDLNVFNHCMNDIRAQGLCIDQETVFVHAGGEIIPTIKNVRVFEHEDEPFIFVNIRNVCTVDTLNKQLRQAEFKAQKTAQELSRIVAARELELSTTRMQLDDVLSSINEIIWYLDDRSMTVQYVSDAVEKIFGVPKHEFIAAPHLWQEMVFPDDRDRVRGFFLNLQPGASQSIDFRIQRRDGEVRWVNNRVVHHSGLSFFVGVTIDITEARQTQEMIEFMAYHDALTRLPNRTDLKRRIETTLARAAIINQQIAVLFLDLDNFKYINDTLGHEFGDEVLIEVADRLRSVMDHKSVCTRFGGDEFIILMSDIHDHADIVRMAEALIGTFKTPFTIHEHEFFVSCSIGISLYPIHAANSTDLIKHADTAMYAAKKDGKNRYAFYDKSMDQHITDFLRLENLIREGMLNGYFALHFQPLIHAASSELEGFEGLLRLHHPEFGFIPPSEFIPVAEATGDILPLSHFVLEEACRFIKSANDVSGKKLFVSVNISARHFREEHFARKFLKTLNAYGVQEPCIKIELTESVIMENIEVAVRELAQLRKAGVKIALDDFGTGYSSFEYLAKLPIDTIKIDKSFVINLFHDKSNEHIIEAVTQLAHAMEKHVTAEGVESSDHAGYLQTKGVDQLQGFAISKALPGDYILETLRTDNTSYNVCSVSEFSI